MLTMSWQIDQGIVLALYLLVHTNMKMLQINGFVLFTSTTSQIDVCNMHTLGAYKRYSNSL